jgi:hypothetical protein
MKLSEIYPSSLQALVLFELAVEVLRIQIPAHRGTRPWRPFKPQLIVHKRSQIPVGFRFVTFGFVSALSNRLRRLGLR